MLQAGLLVMALAAAGVGEDGADTPLNAVVVTAGGRAEPAGVQPISLVALGGGEIERRGLNGIDDLARAAPGLSFIRTAYGATTQISLRGVSSRVGSATTGLYLDDTAIQVRALGFTAANAFPALFDLERIEVLRGPQGTLYGAGAEGGAVRFITPDADLARPVRRLKLEEADTAGGEASYEVGAVVGAPLADGKAALRLALWTRRDGGYIDQVDRETGQRLGRDVNRQDSRLARLALTLAPTSRLTISSKLEWQDRRLKDSNAYWEAFSDPGAGRLASAFRTPGSDRDRWTLPSMKLTWRGGGVSFTSATSYFQRTDVSVIDYSTFIPSSFGPPVVKGLPGYVAQAQMANKQTAISQEFGLQSTGEGRPIDWLAGVYLSSSRQRAIESVVDPQADALAQAAFGASFAQATGQPLIDGRYSFLLNDTGRDRQAAVFGEVRGHLSPRLTLIGGLRAAETRFEYRGRQAGGYAGGVTGGVGSLSEHPVTPKFGLTYEPAAGTLLYLSAAKGYRIGGVNASTPALRCARDLAALGLVATPASFASDHVWSYEAGLKATAPNRKLALQSSLYRIEWSDIQQSVSLPGCGFLYTDNLGRARSQGFELALQAEPALGLSLSASLAYVDARYRDGVQGGFIAAGRRATIVSPDDRLGVRPWSLSVSAEYRFRAAGAPTYLRADYEALSRQAAPTPVNDPLAVSYDPGLPPAGWAALLNARAGVRLNEVEVSLFADNLLDTAPRLLRAHDSKTSPLYAGVTQRPRTAGVRVGYGF